jgi:hypothetical protein
MKFIKLNEICTFHSGLDDTYNDLLNDDNKNETNIIPILYDLCRYDDCENSKHRELCKEYEKYSIKKSDIIIRINNLSKSFVWIGNKKCYLGANQFIIRIKNIKYIPEYIFYYLMFNSKQIKECKIPIISIKNQKIIINILNSYFKIYGIVENKHYISLITSFTHIPLFDLLLLNKYDMFKSIIQAFIDLSSKGELSNYDPKYVYYYLILNNNKLNNVAMVTQKNVVLLLNKYNVYKLRILVKEYFKNCNIFNLLVFNKYHIFENIIGYLQLELEDVDKVYINNLIKYLLIIANNNNIKIKKQYGNLSMLLSCK